MRNASLQIRVDPVNDVAGSQAEQDVSVLDLEPNPALLREFDYVPLVQWQCTRCLSFGYVEFSHYDCQIIERAWTAHELAAPDCCQQAGHKYVFTKKEPAE